RNEEEWEKILQEQLDQLLYQMRRIDRDFDSRSQDMAKAYIRYIASRRDVASMLNSGPALTLEYTYAKPSFQPGLHTIKGAFAFSPRGGKAGAANPGIITFNAS